MQSTCNNKKNIFFSFWGLFLVLIFFESFLFKTYVLREITKYYPTNFDQTTFLAKSYSLYEYMLSNGIISTCAYAMEHTLPPTLLLPLEAALLFLFFGVSRYAALLLNLFYFIFLQAFAASTIKKITGHYSLALIFIGLLLSATFPFFWAGGIIDFRVDFIAACLYGAVITSVIRSQIFLDRKWTGITTVLACLLILTRYITITYVGLTLFLTIFYFVYELYRRKKLRIELIGIKIRFKNSIYFSLLVSLFVAPFLWINRMALYGYYVVGHITGQEKYIRALEQGTTNLTAALKFYPNSILYDHLGFIVIVICFLLGLFALFFKISPKKKAVCALLLPINFRLNVMFLIIAALSPVLILMPQTSPSPVVGDIVIIPLIWLITFGIMYFYQQYTNKIFIFFASIILACGTYNWLNHFGRHSSLYYRDNLGQLNKMYQAIGDYAEAGNLDPIYLSTDRILDSIQTLDLVDIYYEKTGTFLNAQSTSLGGSIFSIAQYQALQSLQETNVFIMNMNGYADKSVYPYDNSVSNMRPLLQQQLNKNFFVLGDYHFDHTDYRVYVRPQFKILGNSGGWITAQGFSAVIPGKVARRAKAIILSGPLNPWISHQLEGAATEHIGNSVKKITLNPKLFISKQGYTIYCPLIDVTNNESEKEIRVDFHFSTFFIPKDRGINSDMRALVLWAPTIKKVILK